MNPIPEVPLSSPPAERSSAASARELLARYTVPNYSRLPLVPDRGEGTCLYDVTGRQFLDFGGGVAVCSLGHASPVITQAITDQAARLIHCSNWYEISGQGELAQFLVETVMAVPGKCLFGNSGAEAIEALLKLARKFGHLTPAPDGRPRTGIITLEQSFHGRTFGGISATGQQKVKDGFEPLLPGFTHIPCNDIAALEAAVTDETAAILLEPLQGEGGVNPVSAEFLRAAARICRERNLLLLFDEIQCGLGRAGHWCGWKPVAPEIVPDGVAWAKGMGGGFPVGAVWIRHRGIGRDGTGTALCDILGPGSHGTTYGGSPLACAVALAVLREIRGRDLCARSERAGDRIRRTVAEWNHPAITDVRGRGLMIGFELNPQALAEGGRFSPEEGPASMAVVRALMDQGLLTVAAGPSVVRWLPPLTVSDAEIDTALAIQRRVLDSFLAPSG